MDLVILSGPIIGAVIGYGTNWIAIKMLFRPRKPVKIGKFTLPFTPGIIPKRKDKLAKAIGEMVGNNLFTKSDVEKILLSGEMENTEVKGNKLGKGIKKIYQNFVSKRVGVLVDKMDISKIVEEKVAKMEVRELEHLLFSVMKKELGAIVNLGALIGFLLGTLNIVM